MIDPSRAMQNLNGAARLVAEAAANLRTIDDKGTTVLSLAVTGIFFRLS
jgi:hypothetical protein